jgi:hypothetical protein
LGKLKVELDSGALIFALKSIGDCDVDLWAVKSTVTGVELPYAASSLLISVESRAKSVLSAVPGLDLAEKLLRTGGEL